MQPNEARRVLLAAECLEKAILEKVTDSNVKRLMHRDVTEVKIALRNELLRSEGRVV